LPARCR